MKFLPPLKQATLIQRYKRFLADIKLPCGKEKTIHCANTGAMTGCGSKGDTIWYSTSSNPKRKYPNSRHALQVTRQAWRPVLLFFLCDSVNHGSELNMRSSHEVYWVWKKLRALNRHQGRFWLSYQSEWCKDFVQKPSGSFLKPDGLVYHRSGNIPVVDFFFVFTGAATANKETV